MCALCDKLRNAWGWRTLYSDKVTSMNSRNYSLLGGLVALGLAAGLLAGCASTPPAKPAAAPHHDTTALTVIAEADLKRGDCRSASENYARAAANGDAQLARRATQVAMACEHLPAAWQAATRWRSLAPNDREANALYAAVALKLYRTADARAAINDFWRAEEQLEAAAAGAAPQSAPVPGATAPGLPLAGRTRTPQQRASK